MPIDESRSFLPVNIAVLTVSDTRDLASDRSGDRSGPIASASRSAPGIAALFARAARVTPARSWVARERIRLTPSRK